MSAHEHPNAALIRGLHGAFSRGDYLPLLAQLLAEDVVWHLPGSHPLSGDHRGRDAVVAAILRFDELGGGTFRTELHDVVAGDEHAAALLRATGRRRGRHYDAREIDIYHMRDGKIVEFWSLSEDQRATDDFWS